MQVIRTNTKSSFKQLLLRIQHFENKVTAIQIEYFDTVDHYELRVRKASASICTCKVSDMCARPCANNCSANSRSTYFERENRARCHEQNNDMRYLDKEEKSAHQKTFANVILIQSEILAFFFSFFFFQKAHQALRRQISALEAWRFPSIHRRRLHDGRLGLVGVLIQDPHFPTGFGAGQF